MKRFQIFLFLFAALFAPLAVQAQSNKPITIVIAAGVPHFHPVYDGASQNIRFFETQTNDSGFSFDVHPDTIYEVKQFVNGVYVLTGHVKWDANGVPTQLP
jgi:hypothetical protein